MGMFKSIYRRVYRKIREVRCFVQRGKNGYSDFDLWSLDYHLAEVINKSTVELGNNPVGYPSRLNSDAEWKDILKQISDGFRIYNEKEECENKECDYGVWWWDRGGCSDHPKEAYDRAWELLKEWFPALWY